MQRGQLWVSITVIALTSGVLAAEKPAPKKPQHSSSVAVKKIKGASSPWVPIPWKEDVGNLPPNYSGMEPTKFLELFEERANAIVKGEFETSEEFKKRTENKNTLLAPISTTLAYAFRIVDMPMQYDADAQAYIVGGKYKYTCRNAVSLGDRDNWITCKVAALFRVSDTYVASNAYGVKRVVERTAGRDLALAIHNQSNFRKRAFVEQLYPEPQLAFQDRLPIPLEKARSLKGRTTAALFVGHVVDARIVNGRGTFIEATIDSPSGVSIVEQAIPFEVTKVVYYIAETGEVLGVRTYSSE